jgi:L-threonylcarbamoyladenylate synthase
VEALSRGRLVLHPTETVVSLSGDPYDDDAVARARALKGYRAPRPFLCLVPGIDAARSLASAWPAEADQLASRFWPGPLTLLLPASDGAPAAVAASGTIALRPAADPVSAALLAAWGRALFSTSANRRGQPTHRDVAGALVELGAVSGGSAIEVALLPVGKDDPGGLPSTIVDATIRPVRIVREGAIPAETIRGVVGELGEGAR